MVEAEVVQFLSALASSMGTSVARAAAEAIAGGVSLVALRQGLRQVYRQVKERRTAGERSSPQGYRQGNGSHLPWSLVESGDMQSRGASEVRRQRRLHEESKGR